MLGFGAAVTHSSSAVGTVNQTGKTVGVSAICGSRLFLRAHSACNIPSVLVNDSFVRIGEYHQFISGGRSALLRLEVLADGFTQHGMTEIFLPVKDIANGSSTPSVGVCVILISAILRRGLGSIGRWYQHLLRCQYFSNGSSSDALASHTEYSSDYLCGRLVHIKLLLIVLGAFVAIRDRTTTTQAFLHPGLKDCLDFVACIFGIPLVHDIQKRGKVIVCGIGTINAVVDSNEAYSFFGNTTSV